MKGEIVTLQLFDVGGTLDLGALERAMVGRNPQRAPPVGKGTPAYVEFPQPLVIRHEPVAIESPVGTLAAEVSLVYFPIGAVSVRLRAPLSVANLSDLRNWPQARATVDGQRVGLDAAARMLFERERPRWGQAVRDRYTHQVLSESYTVFAFSDVGEPAAQFVERHRADVAGLLKFEDGSRLHEKEVQEALKKWFSYYDDDIVVLDWDAAFLIDATPEYEDLIFVLEIANLQLLEFRAYDDYLDDAIARGYDELGRLFHPLSLFRNARRTAHELSLLRIEIAELADEADNITKFLGDWFLARVYQAAKEKFHLGDWRATVDEKLGTMNQLYQLAHNEGDQRRMITLELLIVLLFILDLIALVLL